MYKVVDSITVINKFIISYIYHFAIIPIYFKKCQICPAAISVKMGFMGPQDFKVVLYAPHRVYLVKCNVLANHGRLSMQWHGRPAVIHWIYNYKQMQQFYFMEGGNRLSLIKQWESCKGWCMMKMPLCHALAAIISYVLLDDGRFSTLISPTVGCFSSTWAGVLVSIGVSARAPARALPEVSAEESICMAHQTMVRAARVCMHSWRTHDVSAYRSFSE